MAPPKNQTEPRLRVVADNAASELSARPIQRPTGLVEEVYTRVRAEIMSLAIPPDTRVTIESLARRLGVSQTPVREALSMLEAKGLVTKQQFIGYCTAPILNRTQFEEIHEIRMLIEPYAARQAAERMTGEQIGSLHRLVEGMAPGSDAQTRSSYDRFAEQDSEFHERIAMATGNMLIADSLARMHIHLHISASASAARSPAMPTTNMPGSWPPSPRATATPPKRRCGPTSSIPISAFCSSPCPDALQYGGANCRLPVFPVRLHASGPPRSHANNKEHSQEDSV